MLSQLQKLFWDETRKTVLENDLGDRLWRPVKINHMQSPVVGLRERSMALANFENQ